MQSCLMWRAVHECGVAYSLILLISYYMHTECQRTMMAKAVWTSLIESGLRLDTLMKKNRSGDLLSQLFEICTFD
jgi:hypothetical protein